MRTIKMKGNQKLNKIEQKIWEYIVMKMKNYFNSQNMSHMTLKFHRLNHSDISSTRLIEI